MKHPGVVLVASSVILAIAFGWYERDEYWYSAEYGLGYSFGIIGLTLMALLMLYPARKHWRPMSRMFPVRYWFRIHMLFGVVGPVFILFHANFGLGSLNSNVALFSMLLVATSGLVGRYVYSQIHRGLYGEVIVYQDLVKSFQAEPTASDEVMKSLKSRLDQDEASMLRLLAHWRSSRRALAKETDMARARAWGVLVSMARLRMFNRLFSLWHVFHLPFFFMMCVTAAIHVVVVHMY